MPVGPDAAPEGGGDVRERISDVAPPAATPAIQPVSPSERRLSAAELRELRLRVQHVVEVTPGLEGVVVADAYEAAGPADSEAVHIYVTGKLRNEDQRGLVEDAFRSVVSERSYWHELPVPINVDLSGIPVVGFSSALASRYYGLALEYFWRCDLDRSDRAIMLAVAEAPDVVVYRYWSVLTAVAREDFATARLKLRPLLALDPYGSSAPDVAEALERVQGPLRMTLQKLEKELLLEGRILPQASPAPPEPGAAPYEEQPDAGPAA
jgi:hypothetical protein